MQVQIVKNQVSGRISQITALVNSSISSLGTEQLNYKQSPDSWSLLECLEHLNRYCRYYNAALEKAIKDAAGTHPHELQIGWFGKKCISSVEVANTKKQKTLKHLNPTGSKLDKGVISEFLTHQQDLLELLDDAMKTDLNRRLVPVEFFKLLKMSTGVTFLFVTAHQERHMQQLLRILAALPGRGPATAGGKPQNMPRVAV